jgi:hypothetical protein
VSGRPATGEAEGVVPQAAKPDAPKPEGPKAIAPAGARSDDISELKSQLAAMQAKLEELSRKS